MDRMKALMSVLLLVLLSGCSWMYELGQGSEYDVSDAGITVPEFTFVNQENQSFGTADLDGNYWLANFAFTNCTTVCLTMMPNMSHLQDSLQEEGVNLPFVTFTADPIKDTPEQLNQYAANIGASAEQWAFLTGYEIEEISTFSQEGFKVPYQYGEQPEDIIHSTSFYLIDENGLMIRKFNGMQMNQEDYIKDILNEVGEDS